LPKEAAFPVEAIVIKYIPALLLPLSPPPNIPRVALEQPPIPALVTVKEPKLVAFPVVAIVT
jgi:hypothetical protein